MSRHLLVYKSAHYSNAQLQKAWALIQPKTHWKDKIDAIVSDKENRHVIAEAITHFTGSIAEITESRNGHFRVRADGYWLTRGSSMHRNVPGVSA